MFSRRLFAKLWLLFFGTMASFIACASHISYSIEYSTADGPSLSNAKVRGQIFRNGTPGGYFSIKTDPNGTFTLENDTGSRVSIAIYAIEGEKGKIFQCHGNSTPNSNAITVKCPRNH